MYKLYVILTIAILAEGAVDKRNHVVSHVDTEVKIQLHLSDVLKDFSEKLNDKSSDDFQRKASQFCSKLEKVFHGDLPVIISGSEPLKFEKCEVEKFNVKTFNGLILETTVDFYLYFTGRYDEKLVPAIFNAIVKNRDKSAKPSHKGKGVVSIGGLYFYQFDIMSITVWVNTHEIEDDERFDRRSSLETRLLEILLDSQIGKTVARRTMDHNSSERMVYERIPVQRINEKLQRLMKIEQITATNTENREYNDDAFALQ
ncbi:uncharacterized protein LOC143066436 [Mytilus galloprovincialis]|uniref:Uncharacterized protein n=1 Tax=Mytilus galloprovincialis TaxID=29158 RepID=A0A8B6BIQ6_MYTGA|nr:Hypothetical predicted protein [Mytilus galloprovincialis]